MLWCMAGTTPKARALGAELRKARQAAKLGVRELAAMLETSHATISRWETGQRSPLPEDVSAYAAKVGASAEVRQQLIDLARDADGPHWLSVGMPEQQRQLAGLLEVERTATRITTVSTLLIPGLLQTGDYARAIMHAADVPAGEVDTRVAVRLGRREAITGRNPAQLVAYLGESVLHAEIGGPEVMADQLDALLDTTKRPNIEIRIIPTRSDWHPGLDGPFSIAEASDRGPVVHLENRISGLFLHEPDEVEVYQSAVDKVNKTAMSVEESIALIARVVDGKETTP